MKKVIGVLALAFLGSSGFSSQTGSPGGKNPALLGVSHTVLVTPDGLVWSWGANGAGQLGDAREGEDRATPAAVDGLPSVRAVSAGGDFTVALRRDGSLVAWGSNASGQL